MLQLVSHALCPYVQRAAIVLQEKGAPFERIDVDLADKPAWFLAINPLGRTPVLLVDGEPIFESAVICEYLDETLGPRLHPEHPLARARHRAWMQFGSEVLGSIAAFYNAPTDDALAQRASELRHRFEQVEAVLGEGPWFDGNRFSIVDAVFGPVFRYFDTFDAIGDFGVLRGLDKVQVWRQALGARPSTQQAVSDDYPRRLREFIERRGSALSSRLAATA